MNAGNTIKIKKPVFEQIMESVGQLPTESGGVFGLKDNVICNFYFDREAGYGTRFYRPTYERVTTVVNEWARSDICFGGFLHSHPEGFTELSAMDKVAAEMVIGVNGLDGIFMALLVGGRDLYMYKLERCEGEDHSRVQVFRVEIVN